MDRDLLLDYYATHGEREWQRLTLPEGSLEFAVTQQALLAHLPPAGRVLDIGGGPGRYTLWLAERGYRVVLADLSPALLDIARAQIAASGVAGRVESVELCDVRDLSRFSDASFDAVLCLGPFYHLLQPAGRAQAAAELARVLRPGGPLFAAFIPLYTFLRRAVSYPDERHHLADPEFVRRLMEEGVFINSVPGHFTAAYGVRPEAVAPFFEGHGFEPIALLADTGFATPVVQDLAELATANPAAYQAAMRLVLDSAADPSLLGACIHLLYVGRKHI